MNATLTDIRDECDSISSRGLDYDRRMRHRVPEAGVVDKAAFLAERCRDKVVLSLGCTGGYQEVVDGVAQRCYGVDKEYVQRKHFEFVDLDAIDLDLPWTGEGINLIWAGEVLEHLTNPGNCLRSLRAYGCPIIITAPNAFCAIGAAHLRNGIENVNIDHVAYYSYWTLLRLVEKCGYTLREWYWYNGKPLFAEGLVFIVEPVAD
jgi:hypothetical protein